MSRIDTIVAISSAVGPAARMIVRLSGSSAFAIVKKLIPAFDTSNVQRAIVDVGGLRVPSTVYVFKSPGSYTGDDLIELHLPGNPWLAERALRLCINHGVRLADPGEFTARAYFNGRIDLAAAEGVAATIAAQNESELSAARQLMAGELARRLAPAMDALAGTLALIEAGIDFSEEDVTFLDADQTLARIDEVDAFLAELLASSSRFESIAHEPTVVLRGRPNAGKSTLLNALAKHHRAVISDVAGTTRDVLSAPVKLARGIIRLIDVAGLDVATDGSIDRQMQDRARRAIETADFVLDLRAADDPRPPISNARKAELDILTKVDLVGSNAFTDGTCRVSAKTGEGIDALRNAVDRLVFGGQHSGTKLALNARHVTAIDAGRNGLARARSLVRESPELIALELREALNALGEVLGQITPDDLLGRVFATFCIGK